MDVTIIIVSYNTANLLKQCLESIYRCTKDVDFEVIVSDNNSHDGSVELLKKDFPQVRVIENKRNLGFGAANNVALKYAKGEYILYLNSDTIVLNNAVKEFYDYWQRAGYREHLGAIGTMLIDIDGRYGDSFGHFTTLQKSIKYLRNCFLSSIGIKYIYSLFRETNKYEEYYGNVDYVIGADLFLRNDENAVFDERFFMYFEENDLQLAMKAKGLERKIIPGPQIIHLEGGSEHRNKLLYKFNKATTVYYWSSCVAYLDKHGFNPLKLKLLLFLIYLLPWNLFAKKGIHNLKCIIYA